MFAGKTTALRSEIVGDRTSALASVIESYASEPLGELADGRIVADFDELHRGIEALKVQRLRRLAVIDRRGVHARDGFLSPVAWLGARHHLAWGVANDGVRTARALEGMPATRTALERAEVSLSAVRVLVAAREAEPGAFEGAEAQLVEAARIHRVADLQRVVAHWRQAVESETARGNDEALRERRRLHASVTLGGMVRVDGDLDPETGQTLLCALGAVLDAEARSGTGDTRTPGQKRSDALGEICRQWLDRGDRPAVAGERPHVSVMLGLDDLKGLQDTGLQGTSGEFEHTGPLSPGAARRLACDAAITRVVMAPRSEPLDVGRRTSVVPPAIRRAVICRDRRCRFPGCDRPQSWCDAHHVLHRADGGPTSLANLVLLCRRHHRMVHERGGFTLEMLDHRPVFRRPDGSVLEDRAPP
jgi:hypothetical protein